MTLPLVQTLPELRHALAAARASGRPIRFVPTMGALHEGHAALVRQARADGGLVVMSVFVNPTQFGPTEDLARYPRTPEADAALAGSAGADLMWFPEVEDIYPPGEETRVRVGGLADVLCGAVRPGHFEGVATVVTKLLAATLPDTMYLGEKDFQQTVVLRRVLRDLLFATEVRVVPTVREPDGLALSSRNRYLDADGRRAAQVIPRALAAARDGAFAGEPAAAVLARATCTLDAELGFRAQYIELRDERTLAAVDRVDAHTRLFIAGFVGATRLIDNQRVL